MKVIEYKGYRVDITYRANAQRMTLHHRPGADHFTMSAPSGIGDRTVLAFLAKNEVWMRHEMSTPASLEACPTGNVEFRGYKLKVTERANAKRIILHHRPHEDFFTLTVPVGCSKQEVLKVLEENLGWMKEALTKANLPDWQPTYAAGEQHWVLGSLVTLGQNGVPTGQAAFWQYRTEKLQTVLQRELERWQRIMGVRITSVTLRSLRSKWGSCRPKTGALTFAAELGMYPEACVTEVVVHELNHMRHPDHSAAFYADMDRFYPAWRQASELKKTFDINPRRPTR